MNKISTLQSVKVTSRTLEIGITGIGIISTPSNTAGAVKLLNNMANHSLIASSELLGLVDISHLEIPATTLFQHYEHL